MSRMMMMVSVRLAFFCVGSRKALTPFETASTPVMAVHPLAKTLARTQRESMDPAHRQARGLDQRYRMSASRENPHRSNHNHKQQRADEKVSRDEESTACILDAAHVDQRKDEQDSEAERERVRLQPRKGRNQRSHSRRDADSRVEYVVDHKRRGGAADRRTRPGSQKPPCSFLPHAGRRRWSVNRRRRRWPAGR